MGLTRPAQRRGRAPADGPALGFPVVGIGASAGGLEAFTQLLKHLPSDTGMAFVLIQHLDPTHTSFLSEALARATAMVVGEATDGAVIEPDHVYVIPPEADLAIVTGRLALVPRSDDKPHLPIDTFLRALASECGSRAVGVILSGTASDGTEGLKAIKAADGITFAQDPVSAKFPGMPRSALDAGVVDHCLALPQLAEALVRLSRHSYLGADTAAAPPGEAAILHELFGLVRKTVGVDFSEYKGATFERRLARRMALRGVEDCAAYLELLRLEPDEIRFLFEDLLVELQSTNEELTTVNDELHSRNQELSLVNSDLVNLLGAVDMPLLIVDKARRIRRFTPRARSILNVVPADIGRPLGDLRINLAVDDLDAQTVAVMATMVAKEAEVQDREGHWYRLQIRPYKTTDDRIDGAIVSLVDIDALKHHVATAQLARTDAERANRAKDQFLAVLSHELRSPLSSMLLQAQLLREKDMDPARIRRASEAIERGTRVQVKLIDDLLDVSRIVNGKLRMDKRIVDLCDVIRAALDGVSAVAARKSITISVALDAATGKVDADSTRLQQVVSNLLTNAIKFTPEGGKVGVELAVVDGCARLVVSDTGIGIEAVFLPHVFRRFAQEDSSTTRNHGGLGLGLAIVHHIVEAHGGTVHATSPGKGAGATFSVDLPLAPVTRGDPAAAAPRAPGSDGRPVREVGLLQDLRVLIIDDDDVSGDAVGGMLQQRGAQIAVATSAVEARAVVERFQPDVLVCDIAMPGEDGYEFITRLRRLGPAAGGAIPALALTAFSTDADRERTLAAGFQMHLTKPVDIEQLTVAVGGLVKSRSVGRPAVAADR